MIAYRIRALPLPEPPAPQPAPPTIPTIISRLMFARTTATNDDRSGAGTKERARFVERDATMADAVVFLEGVDPNSADKLTAIIRLHAVLADVRAYLSERSDGHATRLVERIDRVWEGECAPTISLDDTYLIDALAVAREALEVGQAWTMEYLQNCKDENMPAEIERVEGGLSKIRAALAKLSAKGA